MSRLAAVWSWISPRETDSVEAAAEGQQQTRGKAEHEERAPRFGDSVGGHRNIVDHRTPVVGCVSDQRRSGDRVNEQVLTQSVDGISRPTWAPLVKKADAFLG
jgi:hypothetical protein